MNNRFFKVNANVSRDIRNYWLTMQEANFRLLRMLTGVTVRQILVKENLAFGIAEFDGIVTDNPPRRYGWVKIRGTDNHWRPSKRTYQGEAITQRLNHGGDKLHLLGGFGALKQFNINPFWLSEDGNTGGHVGIDISTDYVLLTWNKEWGDPNWPNTVTEIRASEYYALIEAAEDAAQEAAAGAALPDAQRATPNYGGAA